MESPTMTLRTSKAFTLIEILIVVVILGILAAIAIFQFASVTEEAKMTATSTELQKIRRHIGVFQARNNSRLPSVEAGDGTWGEIVSTDREYLLSAPVNSYVGSNGRVIIIGTGPDSTYQTDYGWIFNPATGEVWAGAYDANDKPIPRP